MEVLQHHGDSSPVALEIVAEPRPAVGAVARAERVYGRIPAVETFPDPMPAWEQDVKRLADVAISLVVLIGGSPLWLAIGMAVKLTSPGPAIYRQQRVGRHGRVFTMYKFRTMRDRAEAETGPVWATENDSRYTRFGRWLRKRRLDEVLQCFNVLAGDMSLVGPRPERPFFVDRLADEIPSYHSRHIVKPGITGWAQVNWKYDASLDDVRRKVAYDLFYIENMGWRLDLRILASTLKTVLFGREIG